MAKRNIPSLFVVCFCGVFSLSLANAREWSDLSGSYSVEAELVEVDGEHVVLRKNNQETIRILTTKLSLADQEYVKGLEVPKKDEPSEAMQRLRHAVNELQAKQTELELLQEQNDILRHKLKTVSSKSAGDIDKDTVIECLHAFELAQRTAVLEARLRDLETEMGQVSQRMSLKEQAGEPTDAEETEATALRRIADAQRVELESLKEHIPQDQSLLELFNQLYRHEQARIAERKHLLEKIAELARENKRRSDAVE